MWRLKTEPCPSQSGQTAQGGFCCSAVDSLWAAAAGLHQLLAEFPVPTGHPEGSGIVDRVWDWGPIPPVETLALPLLSHGTRHSANLAEPVSLPGRWGRHRLLCRVVWKGTRCAELSGNSCSALGEAASSLKETPLGGGTQPLVTGPLQVPMSRASGATVMVRALSRSSPFLHPSAQLLHPFRRGVSPHPQLRPDPATPPLDAGTSAEITSLFQVLTCIRPHAGPPSDSVGRTGFCLSLVVPSALSKYYQV